MHHDDAYTSEPDRKAAEDLFPPLPTLAPRSKLERIEALARGHNHPGVNVGAHALANKIIAIIEETA